MINGSCVLRTNGYAFGEKKEFTQSGIPTPQALHQNRPKGTASIYNL